VNKSISVLLFSGFITLVSGVDFSMVSAQELQKMSTKEQVEYINNFKEEIALMNFDDRRKALDKMRIKMRLQKLPGQSKEYIQQMQLTTSDDMNRMQGMFQQEAYKIVQTTVNTSKTIGDGLPIPF